MRPLQRPSSQPRKRKCKRMAESGDKIILLNEKTQIAPSDANQLAVARRELEGDEVITLNEETEITPADANQLAVARRELEGDEVIPSNEETQIALQSDENQLGVALQASFNLNKGKFDKPVFGPQTNTKHIEANTIEHATITHVHHHYGGDDKSEESLSTSGATGARPKQKHDEGIVQITDDIFMNTSKPLKKSAKIFEGYQEHVTGQRQPLAIKTIVPCTKKSIREVQHLVKLALHPNVVRIIRSKEQQTPLPTLYIVMELCRSQDLQEFLNENREKKIPLDFKKTMSYSRQIVKGMRHIHRKRIVHGDLKPENILFSLDGDQIKLSDFGISQELRQSLSAAKITSQGTDGYRAPETYNSDVISLKADIYSLGVILYSLFTNGGHPFGEELDLWTYKMKKNIGRDLSGLPEEMGAKKEEFLELLDKMLELDPEKRPTIEEILVHPFFSRSDASTTQAFAGQESLKQTSQPTSRKVLSELLGSFFLASEPGLALEEKQTKEAPANHPGISHPSSSRKAGPRIVSDNIEPPKKLDDCKSKVLEKIVVDASHEDSSCYQPQPVLAFHPAETTHPPSSHETGPRNRDVSNHAAAEASKVLEKIEPVEARQFPRPEAESSEIPDGATARSSKSEKSETLRKMEILGIDVNELHSWRVIVRRSRLKCDKRIKKMDRGCVIYYPVEKELPPVRVKINGDEILISELQKIKLPDSTRRLNSSELRLWPGLVIWFDCETFKLFANNCSNAQVEVCNIYNPSLHSGVDSSILPIGLYIPIFSIKEFVDLLHSEKCDDQQHAVRMEGVQIKIVDDSQEVTIIKMFPFSDD